VLSPTFTASCPSVGVSIIPNYDNAEKAVVSTTSTAAVKTRVRVSITASSADGREGTTYMYINVAEASAPSVEVSSLKTYDTYKHNSAISIRLQGSVGPPLRNSSRVVWSVDDPHLPLARLAMTQIAYIYSNSTSRYTSFFALLGNALSVRSGLDRKFTFTLTCASIAITERIGAVSKMAVLVNAPPMAGSMTILPPSGQALRTVYSLLASNWVDSDYPLSYEFLIRGSFSRGSVGNYYNYYNYLQIQGREGNAALEAKLPAGVSGDRDALVIAVTVYDSFSASTFLEGSAGVSPGNSSDIEFLYERLPQAYQMRSDERRVILTTSSGADTYNIFCAYVCADVCVYV